MTVRQARVGTVCYGVGFAVALIGTAGTLLGDGLGPGLAVGAALAGALAALLASTRLDRDRVAALGRRSLPGALGVLSLVALIGGVLAVAFSEAPLSGRVTVLAGGGLAVVGSWLTYAASNRLEIAARRSASSVAIRVDSQSTGILRTGLRIAGLGMVAVIAFDGYAVLHGHDPNLLATMTLVGALSGPQFLAPVRIGRYVPGLTARRYLVDDGVLEPTQVADWEHFEGWTEAGETLELHQSGPALNTVSLSPSEDDREAARSHLDEHLERLD